MATHATPRVKSEPMKKIKNCLVSIFMENLAFLWN